MTFLVLILLAWLAMVAVLVIASLQQRPWEWKFSTASLLVLTTVVAVACGIAAVLREITQH